MGRGGDGWVTVLNIFMAKWIDGRWIQLVVVDREEKYEEEKREDMVRWERYQLTGEAVSREKAAEWFENLARSHR
jgi:hypothetical protein